MRKFYRCKDCLRVIAVDPPPALAGRHAWERINCKCGGEFEFMGNVERQNLTQTHVESVCDERCTSALGPVCNCHCCGENHGSHRVVEVTRIVGKVPEVDLGVDSFRLGTEFRKLYADALQAWTSTKDYADLRAKYKNGTWMPRPDFLRYLEGMAYYRRLHKIHDMKVYSTRERKLREFIETPRGSESVSREAHNLENRVQLTAPLPSDIKTGKAMEADIVKGLPANCRCTIQKIRKEKS